MKEIHYDIDTSPILVNIPWSIKETTTLSRVSKK